MLGLVQLILTVCTVAEPSSCEERRLSLVDQGSLTQCMAEAQPVIAEWCGTHPNRRVVKWRCSYPGSEESSL